MSIILTVAISLCVYPTFRFRHIHGNGYEIFTADEHKGQSLGDESLTSFELPANDRLLRRPWFILSVAL